MGAAAAVCFLAIVGFAVSPLPALAQDILIVRPLNNSPTIVLEQEFVFEVNVSSFATIVGVKINGEPYPIDPSPTVNVRKQVSLEPGFNTFLVEVTTEFDTVEKEFEIRYGAPDEDDREHFQMVTILGQSSVSNPLKISAAGSEVAGIRSFAVLVPRYDWYPSDSDILRLQMVIARDKYDDEALITEEVAFTQLTFSWILGIGQFNFWEFGAGYNSIYTEYDSFFGGTTRQAYDNLLFTTLHMRFGEAASVAEIGFEIKQQEFVEEPDPNDTIDVNAVDKDEDAEIQTLRLKLVIPLWGFRSNFKFAYATFDTEGKIKRKTQIKISDDMTKTYGPFILGFGLRIKQNNFKEPDPDFNDTVPSERLVSLVGNATWPIFESWILVLEAVTESQSSNVSESEYDNDKLTLSTIFIF